MTAIKKTKTITERLHSLMNQATNCKRKRQARLIRGKFSKILCEETTMSDALRESAMRELQRHFPARHLPY